MQKFFLICSLTFAACAVMAPGAKAMDNQIDVDDVLSFCGSALQGNGDGVFGCTRCSTVINACVDESCNMNDHNGVRLGCFQVSIGAKGARQKRARLQSNPATATTAVAAGTTQPKRVVSHLRETSQSCASLANAYSTSTDWSARHFIWSLGQSMGCSFANW